ncbi:MAG: TonB-dependent receptor [Acidobacteriota bacterium]|nr:TonB-dependent receptor [Acidobacteriota bacterium]
MSRTSREMIATAIFAVLLPAPLWALPQTASSSPPPSLADVSLDDLMNVAVTSVSKKEQTLSRTAAAIYVITQEEIRRSGATNIPDILRMAPGVDVAQIDANTWAVSIRGFNDRYANKVLVLIDGRTVYTPTTSGVYWDELDVPSEDIDRIEVIRGPGATVWGANAVNGVINIITKSARVTQGATLSAGGGSQGAAQGFAQYGGTVGKIGAYRLFGNYSNRGNLTASDGRTGAADGWHMSHAGMRTDWKITPKDSLTVQGDLLRADEGQTVNVVYTQQLPLQRTLNDAKTVASGNLLGRWNHTLTNGSDTSLQVYFDRTSRTDIGNRELLNTLDIDFQHHFTWGTRHDIVWGAGYRVTADHQTPGYERTYIPLSRTNNLLNVFFQDEIALGHSVWLTLGAKLEHNAYTGKEYEPNAKLLWQLTKKQTIWLSAARAIVQESRSQANLKADLTTFPTAGGGFGVIQVNGNPESTKSEQMYDFEGGYRVQVNNQFSFDLAAFSSSYRNIGAAVAQNPIFVTDPGPPHVVIPLTFEFFNTAHTYGSEIFGTWVVTKRWKISPSLSAIHMTATNFYVVENERNTPQFQGQIRSSFDVTKRLDWDVLFWHVGRLRDGGDGAVPAYNRLDTRMAWRIGEAFEVSVTGQNLLTPLHAEFHNAYDLRRTLVERSVLGKITWRF